MARGGGEKPRILLKAHSSFQILTVFLENMSGLDVNANMATSLSLGGCWIVVSESDACKVYKLVIWDVSRHSRMNLHTVSTINCNWLDYPVKKMSVPLRDGLKTIDWTHYLYYCPDLCKNLRPLYHVPILFLRKQPIAQCWTRLFMDNGNTWPN